MNGSLSQDAIDAYRRDGFLAPLPALTPEEAAGYRNAIETFERQQGLVAGQVIRNKGHLKCRALFDLVSEPRILDAVESVLGPNILVWGSSLFVKEPQDPGFIAWHQDSYYWGLEPDDVVSAWIAFAASTRENGAMRVIPGSHRLPPLPHKASPPSSRNMLFTHEEIAGPVDEAAAVDLLLEQGEMSLHHVKILHGSPPNGSSRRRYGYAIRYVAPHVRQRGDQNTALLVRGRDEHGYFSPDPVPTRDMDPDIVALVDAPLGGAPHGAAQEPKT